MPRSVDDINKDLDEAFALSRKTRLGTHEYRASRRAIAALVRELAAATPVLPGKFTPEDYERWPDSGEQMGINRKRAEDLLNKQYEVRAEKKAELDRLYRETRKKGAA